jgi:O-antigen/teichoic acid export membrane protein
LRATLLVAVVYGACMALLLLAVAPLLEWMFGSQYRGMALVVAALVPAVPGMALRVVAGTSLMALGRPWMRVFFELAGVCVLVLAALALAPARGVTGMAAAVVASEWVMAVLGLLLVWRVRAQGVPAPAS